MDVEMEEMFSQVISQSGDSDQANNLFANEDDLIDDLCDTSILAHAHIPSTLSQDSKTFNELNDCELGFTPSKKPVEIDPMNEDGLNFGDSGFETINTENARSPKIHGLESFDCELGSTISETAEGIESRNAVCLNFEDPGFESISTENADFAKRQRLELIEVSNSNALQDPPHQIHECLNQHLSDEEHENNSVDLSDDSHLDSELSEIEEPCKNVELTKVTELDPPKSFTDLPESFDQHHANEELAASECFEFAEHIEVSHEAPNAFVSSVSDELQIRKADVTSGSNEANEFGNPKGYDSESLELGDSVSDIESSVDTVSEISQDSSCGEHAPPSQNGFDEEINPIESNTFAKSSQNLTYADLEQPFLSFDAENDNTAEFKQETIDLQSPYTPIKNNSQLVCTFQEEPPIKPLRISNDEEMQNSTQVSTPKPKSNFDLTTPNRLEFLRAKLLQIQTNSADFKRRIKSIINMEDSDVSSDCSVSTIGSG